MHRDPWIATILTEDQELPPGEQIVSALREIPGYQTMEFDWSVSEPTRYVMKTPHATLAVSLMPNQEDPEKNFVPFSVLRRACARAWHWVEAACVVKPAFRQIAVAVLPENEGSEGDALDIALLLTALTAAVLKCGNARAVLWNPSGMLHDPEEFLAHAQGMNRRAIPVELWVEFQMCANSDSSVSYATWGLQSFALDELEVTHAVQAPQWILRWLFNLCHFMLENGPIVEDTHTFGESDSEKFTVTLADTSPEFGRGPGTKVFRIEF